MKQVLIYRILVQFLIVSAVVAGCTKANNSKVDETNVAEKRGYVTKAYQKYFGTPKPAHPDLTYYVLFYPYSGTEPYLAGKVKPIAKETDIYDDLPELSVSKLLQEPPLNEPMLIQLINPETKFRGMRIRKNTAEVDFSKEILDSQVEEWGDGSIIAGLALTLCQFDDIKNVSIEIEGKRQGIIDSRKIEDFLGHISLLEQPFSPDEDLVVTEDQENAIITVKDFLEDVGKDNVYQYLSKATKRDVGSEEEFKKERKSDLHRVIVAEHANWTSALISDAKFEKSKAEITVKGNRTVDSEYRDNDKTTFALPKQKGMWKIDFTEVSETVPPSSSKEEIITGPANISRDQLEQVQAIVDQEQQPWRLDPQKVAAIEGGAFGFDKNNDTFTLILRVDSGQVSGTGEALVEAVHKGMTTYKIFLIQPAKAGAGGIWTIGKVEKK